jgi:hypothetical protein
VNPMISPELVFQQSFLDETGFAKIFLKYSP